MWPADGIPLDPVSDSLSPAFDRVVSFVTVLIAAGFVWFLLSMAPDPRGHGTHVQAGMPACGWVIQYGKPCPTCGVTTSAAHLVRLQPWQSVKTQPFGAALAGFGLYLAVIAAWCLLRKRSFLDFLARLPQVRLVIWGIVLLLASWVYTFLTFTP